MKNYEKSVNCRRNCHKNKSGTLFFRHSVHKKITDHLTNGIVRQHMTCVILSLAGFPKIASANNHNTHRFHRFTHYTLHSRCDYTRPRVESKDLLSCCIVLRTSRSTNGRLNTEILRFLCEQIILFFVFRCFVIECTVYLYLSTPFLYIFCLSIFLFFFS